MIQGNRRLHPTDNPVDSVHYMVKVLTVYPPISSVTRLITSFNRTTSCRRKYNQYIAFFGPIFRWLAVTNLEHASAFPTSQNLLRYCHHFRQQHKFGQKHPYELNNPAHFTHRSEVIPFTFWGADWRHGKRPSRSQSVFERKSRREYSWFVRFLKFNHPSELHSDPQLLFRRFK